MSKESPTVDQPGQDGQLPRPDMISKAVEFLLHPKIQTSTLSQRRAFLAKKGLTAAEITEAIHSSGLEERYDETKQNDPSPTNKVMTVVAQAAPVTLMSRAKDVGVLMLVLGGVSYGIYQMLEKYILPAWVGASEEQKGLKDMKKSVVNLDKTVTVLIESMKKMEGALIDQENNIRQMVNNAAHERGSDALQTVNEANNFKEIKAEITSLKGLLLSRNQFPKSPRTQPLIPSWQLTTSTQANDDCSEEKPTSQSTSAPKETECCLMNSDDGAAAAQKSSYELISPTEESLTGSSGMTNTAGSTMET